MRASANDAEVHCEEDSRDEGTGGEDDSATTDNSGTKEEMKLTKHGMKSFTAISKQVKRFRIRDPYSPLHRQQKKK